MKLSTIDNDFLVCRLKLPLWNMQNFSPWLKEMAELARPQKMTHGLWEYPLFQTQHEGWSQTEFYEQEEFFADGGIKTFSQIRNDPTKPWFNLYQDLTFMGFKLYRFRLLALAPKTTQHTHVDQKSKNPILRLHVPLLTHSKAFLDYYPTPKKRHRHHLSARGETYIINVAKPHRVCNLDERKWRLHLVADLQKVRHDYDVEIVTGEKSDE
ncbi:MAG: hypothetical protein K2P81_14800 [Bacteriovoracaceae bacterium]|nr:hypothetical protein [Bacteriovoracaceae bacterium]